jgi:hypothetical protein
VFQYDEVLADVWIRYINGLEERDVTDVKAPVAWVYRAAEIANEMST